MVLLQEVSQDAILCYLFEMMIRRPPVASCHMMASGQRLTKQPLEDHPEPELNSPRIIRADEGKRVALKLVRADGFEPLQVKGTARQIQGCTGVGNLQRLDGGELVPHLVEVDSVQNVGTNRDK